MFDLRNLGSSRFLDANRSAVAGLATFVLTLAGGSALAQDTASEAKPAPAEASEPKPAAQAEASEPKPAAPAEAPYKRFVRMIEEQVAKRASAADEEARQKTQAAATQTVHADKTKAEETAAKTPESKKIDVGTVAAIGVAVAGMATFLSSMAQVARPSCRTTGGWTEVPDRIDTHRNLHVSIPDSERP